MSDKTDFLIVGGGIAGISVQYELHRRGIPSMCIDMPSENASSRVAAGIVNPIAGKFFSLSWRANDFFPGLRAYYEMLESKLNTEFFHPKKLVRIFSSAGEQNLWLSKSQQARFAPYCSFDPDGVKELHSPFGVLNIANGGYLDTGTFLDSMRSYLNAHEQYREEIFDHAELDLNSSSYKDISFKKIIFCEGYRVVQDPLFEFLPFTPNKGELLEIVAPDLEMDYIAVGSTFIMPLGDQRYKVGATYEHQYLDAIPSDRNKLQLQDRLSKMMTTYYDITGHWAGIRPAVKDRRPILGQHPEYSNAYIFNGLGSKGVSMAPQLAYELVDKILEGKTLDPNCDISRYYELA